MIAMHKNQPSLQIKNPKKKQLTTSKIKNSRKKICKGVDGVRKLTVKSTTNPYKRFRSKKRGLRSKMCEKSYLNPNVHRYVAKTESQQREELQIRTLQTATPFSSSASVSSQQSINTFSEGKIKQTQFHIWQGRVFTLHLSKKNPKTNRKTRRLRTSKNSAQYWISSENNWFSLHHFWKIMIQLWT